MSLPSRAAYYTEDNILIDTHFINCGWTSGYDDIAGVFNKSRKHDFYAPAYKEKDGHKSVYVVAYGIKIPCEIVEYVQENNKYEELSLILENIDKLDNSQKGFEHILAKFYSDLHNEFIYDPYFWIKLSTKCEEIKLLNKKYLEAQNERMKNMGQIKFPKLASNYPMISVSDIINVQPMTTPIGDTFKIKTEYRNE